MMLRARCSKRGCNALLYPVLLGARRRPLTAAPSGLFRAGGLAARYAAPTWADNDVNPLALGGLAPIPQPRRCDTPVQRAGRRPVGAAIVIDGHLYRGANGSAGDLGTWPFLR